MTMFLRVATAMILVTAAACGARSEARPARATALSPEEAVTHGANETLTVQFKVKSARMRQNPAFVPAGEETDYIDFKYADRFYFHLYGRAVTILQRLGIDPSAHFRDKVVRVTGKLFANGDPADPNTPYGLVVEGLEQFEVVQ